MKIENVEGIVWDLDGTLLNSFGIFEQIITDVVQESGHDMPTREYMQLNYHGSLEDTIQKNIRVKFRPRARSDSKFISRKTEPLLSRRFGYSPI